MKKILSLMLILVLLAGCTTIQETKTPDPPKSLSYEDSDFGERFEKTKPGEETLKTYGTLLKKVMLYSVQMKIDSIHPLASILH